MNRKEIRDRVLNGLDESPDSPIFWSTDQIDDLIGDGQEFLSEELRAITRTAFSAVRPGATYYATRSFAPDVQLPLRVYLQSLDRRLSSITVDQLDRFHQRWLTVTGASESWFPMGWDWFGIWPASTEGSGWLRLDYLAWPRPLLDDGDHSEFPESDQDGLVIYAIFQGLLKRWDAANAVQAFSLLADRFRQGKARTGVRRMGNMMVSRSEGPGQFHRTGIIGNRRLGVNN